MTSAQWQSKRDEYQERARIERARGRDASIWEWRADNAEIGRRAAESRELLESMIRSLAD